MDQYQQYIHKSRYARYLDEENRRETWEETVMRYVSFWGNELSTEDKGELYTAILNMEVMPLVLPQQETTQQDSTALTYLSTAHAPLTS